MSSGSERQQPVRRAVTGWPAVTLVGASFGVTMLGTTLPTPLYPLYAQWFGFSELIVTVVFAVYPVGVTAALLMFGSWSDQLGRKPMLLAGLLLSGLSAVALLLPGGPAWLFAARVLSGLSAGIFTGTATATIVDLAPAYGKARAGLVAAAVNMGGLGAGPLLSGTLSQWAPEPLTLCFVVDLVLLTAAMICVLLIHEPVRRARSLDLSPQTLRVPTEVRGIFTRAVIAGFAGFAVLGLFVAVSPAFLAEVLHDGNRALTGGVVISVFIASIVGQTMSSRFGERRALTVGCAGLIGGMALIGTSLPTSSLPTLVAGGVVAGLGQGMSFRAGLGAVTGASPPGQRGEIASAFFVMLYVGIALPVVGEGAAATSFGLVAAGLMFSALVGVLAAIVLILLMRSSRRGNSLPAELR